MEKIAIYSIAKEPHQKDILQKVINRITSHDIKVLLHKPLYRIVEINDNSKIGIFDKKEDLSEATLLLSIGGDGTFLRAASLIGESEIPILGINGGRLGFLSDLTPNDIQDLPNIIKQKKYNIKKRSVLKLNSDIPEINNLFALNDIAIFKRETLGILNIETIIDGHFLTNYWADGILVATPTGSTAYSLSLGGPIIAPENNCFIINQMAPHNLTARPIIVPDTSKIELLVKSRDKNFNISIDSHSHILPSGTKLTIEKAQHSVFVAKPQNYNYYETLKNKLIWGVDPRNQ